MQEFEHLGWQTAPVWAEVAGVAGRSLVFAALGFYLLCVLANLAARPRLGNIAFVLGGVSLLGTFGCLAALFVGDQFQYQYVFSRGEAATAFKYKIAGIWSGQQGSFLLWGCMSALAGIAAAPGTGSLRRWFSIPYALFLAALSGILAYETPFAKIPEAGNLLPPTGAGLTPSLQNYWVVIHPPTIFLGFGLLTVLFCWSISAMVARDPSGWLPGVRPWAILSIGVLGVGLCMGGFWAYETLGWGGFWMWDPVENVSFVPWILTVAFTHGIMVQVAKGRWGPSNLLLGGLPFLAFVYGTFLTRSGFLAEASVHSFAQMDSTAHKVLLGFFFASVLGFLGVWLIRGRTMRDPREADVDSGLHRESAYFWGVLLLCATATATAIGMSVPLFMALSGKQPKVVEEHVYHTVLGWFFVPTFLLVAIAPFLSWRRRTMRDLLSALLNPLSATVGLIGLGLLLLNRSEWTAGAYRGETVAFPFGLEVPLAPWVLLLAALCVFAAAANLARLANLWKRGRSSAGGFLAHAGIALLMGGLIVSRGFERKSEIVLLQRGATASALGFEITHKGRTIESGDPEAFLFNRDNKIALEMKGHGGEFTAYPGLFYVRNQQDPEGTPNQMVWPHIQRSLGHDVYVTLRSEEFDIGDPQMIRPGETKDFSGLKVTYVEPTRVGEPGVPGTRFGARVRVESPETGLSAEATPELELAEGGLVPSFANTGAGILVTMQAMDAGTKGALIQLHRERPAYPVEVFYKPMTSFVWAGTGILAIGSLVAAWARRPRRKAALRDPAPLPDV